MFPKFTACFVHCKKILCAMHTPLCLISCKRVQHTHFCVLSTQKGGVATYYLQYNITYHDKFPWMQVYRKPPIFCSVAICKQYSLGFLAMQE
jgi:hypothetical protein